MMLVNHLEKLAQHQRHTLDPLDLHLRPQQFPSQVLLLLLNVILLDSQEFQLALERLEGLVEIFFFFWVFGRGGVQGGFFRFSLERENEGKR